MINQGQAFENAKEVAEITQEKKIKARLPKQPLALTRITKKVIKRILGIVGFEIRRITSPKSSEEVIITLSRNDFDQSLKHILSLNYYPETIVDDGVAEGTGELQDNFPKSRFLWIEPLKEFEHFLKKLSKKLNGQYIIAAAGSFNGFSIIQVDPDLFGSSLLYEESDSYKKRETKVIRLDDLIDEYNLKSDILLKVDVQGYELEVLEGAQELLQNCEIVILELTFIRNVKGIPEFYDVIDYMKKRNYVVYDILSGINRPYDNALFQRDFLFVKENGRFRESNIFATKEQLEEWYKSSKYYVT